ncbi:DUF6173 family protein [Roseovarius indicus]|uniref:Uncharacterized protein n=1 Tax=Roseovarius indicus TaxID=540747 RepID=A0A0T5P6B7_9RHOB|nr:DUF6173 family protein [Roseovarius indicus]KRS16841.1 hypothetical protein XM52_16585 [Roseovarius indicus]OAO06075.1 hypothetical protein A8B76_03850 [Roseovarius indicus]QEW24256.1 hypothetical protein RIdsm_00029 [Roseovarius indicus]SFD73648.1 hypothetical protein SAMN04488031_102173 [Roseovarius indicus]
MDDKIRTAAEAAENDAIPRCHEVHADPETCKGGRDVTNGVTLSPVEEKSEAQWAYERLILYIQNFEKTLDNEHEIAIGFAGAEAGVIRIEGMGFFDPDIVTFYGSDAHGVKTQLIQHVTQLNVMLRALPKMIEHAEPNRIGFRLVEDLERA